MLRPPYTHDEVRMDALSRLRIVIAALALLTLSSQAHGDVIIERKLTVGLLESQPRGVLMTEWIRPDRMRYSTERIFEETIPGDPTGGSTLQILRLDKDIQWAFSQADSSYLEVRLTGLVGTLPWIQAAAGNLSQTARGAERKWKVKTKKTREKQSILGMKSMLFIIEAKGSQETTEGKREYHLKDYIWLTEELPGQAETDSLRSRLAATVGTDISFLPIAIGLYGSFPGVTRMLLAERSGLEGFPLRDSLTLRVINPGEKVKKDEKLTPLFILSVTSARQEPIEEVFYEPLEGYRKKPPQ
jgi:hypothetical protein